VNATDSAGNHASFDALPFVRATSTLPKRVTQSATETPGLSTGSFEVGATITDPSQDGVRVVRYA